MSDKQPMQADGGGQPAPTPGGREGGGESGGGAYREDNATTGANEERKRPVKTGQKPDGRD